MPMNEEVRKAVPQNVADALNFFYRDEAPSDEESWLKVICTELTRLYAIADGVDPMVVRLGEVTTRLEAANGLLVECRRITAHYFSAPQPYDLYERIDAHLSEPRT